VMAPPPYRTVVVALIACVQAAGRSATAKHAKKMLSSEPRPARARLHRDTH
jgi:hypothetical protein